MPGEKLSTKTFIKNINKQKTNSSQLNKDNNVNLNKNVYNIENIILNDSKSNIEEYENLSEILNNLSSCQLSDAYKNISGKSGVIKNMKSINGQNAYGIVFTANAPSYDWGTSIIAIDNANKDDFLLIKNDGDLVAVWGELASKYAKNKGIKAVAVYGAVRDIDALLNFDFPVFALNTTPNAGDSLAIGQLDIDLYIGDLCISSGDFIFADENGVVVIPQDNFSQVIGEALKINRNESNIIDKIDNGESLSKILNLN